MEKPMFQKASSLKKRLKLLAWGASGVGKTYLGLHFPKPVMIDLEGGTDLYGDDFDFDVLRTNDVESIQEAVRYLMFEKHSYMTVIIDPITIFWEALLKRWSDIYLERNKQGKGFKFEYYDFQPGDWGAIKGEYKELLNDLISLDMNVVVTAREKTKYKDTGFMVKAGETFDGEKNTDYMFDTVVRLFKSENNKFMALSQKDRSRKLPAKPFEWTYKTFEDFIGKDTLNRKAVPVNYANSKQKSKIEKLVKELKISETNVNRRLHMYGATCLHDLSEINADIIINNLEEVKKEKGNA